MSLTPFLLAGAALSLLPLQAHTDKSAAPAPHGHHGHAPAAKAGAGGKTYAHAADAWQVARSALATLESQLAAHSYEAVHDSSEEMEAALRSLQTHAATVKPEKRKRLEAALRQSLLFVESVHVAADAGQGAKAASELKKLSAALLLVEAQLSEETRSSHLSPAREPAHHDHAAHAHGPASAGPSTVALQVTSVSPFRAGVKSEVSVRFVRPDGSALTAADLRVAHTERVHLLIVDPSLTDYQHHHPAEQEGRPGDWSFPFTPRAGGVYKVFADIVPVATGNQEYAATEVSVAGPDRAVDTTLNREAVVDGYRFVLEVEEGAELRAGQATPIAVSVTDSEGRPFARLEPLMGAFAHGVGFTADRGGVLHVHPMGREPEGAEERGGPRLEFHLLPQEAGFLKFFVQVRIDGNDRFAGFGLEVRPGAKGSKPSARAYVCPMGCASSDTPGKCPVCHMDLKKSS